LRYSCIAYYFLYQSQDNGKMQVFINGESREFPAALTVAGLVAQLGVNTRQAAIERNREIVPKSQYDETTLQDGDEVEIVGFIGGG
jgi:thiamine biosynthesis protein ThiS